MSELSEKFEEALRPAATGFDVWFAAQSKDDQATYLRYAVHPGLSHRAFHEIVQSKGATAGREKVTDWRKAQGFGRS